MEPLYNGIGVVGALLILMGFYRTSIGRWTHKSLWYELDNACGAALLVVYQLHVGAYISSVLNVIWFIVALRGLSSIGERRGWMRPKRRKAKRA